MTFCAMKRYIVLALAVTLPIVHSVAQEDATDDENIGILAGYFDGTSKNSINYSAFKLPPLEVLFTNARTNPSIELLAKEEKIAKELLRKEKTEFLSHISGHANYSYGVMDNYGSNSNIATPIFYQYMGSKQNYWNVGVNVSFNLEEVIDIRRKVKRKRLEYEKATLLKDIQYEDLKARIVSLYVFINNDLIALKTAAENASSYKAAGMKTQAEFYTNDVTVRELAETKRWESEAVTDYQELQTRITTNILTLEIITHTPIITNVTNRINADDDDD